MELVGEWVDYDSPAGRVSAYLARPQAAGDAVPGVIVVQEIWGVDAHIADVADRLASAGYAALAPDLYSTGGGRPPVLAPERVEAVKAFLNSIPPGEWMSVLGDESRRADALGKLQEGEGARVGETLGTLFGDARSRSEEHLEVLRAGVGFLRAHPACGGRPVGSVGFCMGGGLSAMLACSEPALAAAAIFYGASPSADAVKAIGCPVRGFYGQDDPGIVGGLGAFASALQAAGVDHELRVYPDTPHAFFNDTRPSYRAEAARDAWAGLLQLFATALDPARTVPVAAGST